MMIQRSYNDARFQMKVGDVIAFGGNSHFSGIIKLAVRGAVSHIGILLETQQQDSQTGVRINSLIDATSRRGVKIWRLQDRLDRYKGDVWWLPLQQELHTSLFRSRDFAAFLRRQEGKKYDRQQAAGSAIDFFDRLPFGFRGPGHNHEDYRRFFCSELVAAGLKAAGILPDRLNASEATPQDVCRWNIYESRYYLLKGNAAKQIVGYNSLNPHECRTCRSPQQ